MTRTLSGPFVAFPDCHLWIASFPEVQHESSTRLAEDLGLARMSDRDLNRWNRYRPREKKRQFLESRIAIRAVIAAEFAAGADEIQFETNAIGCPSLLRSDSKPAAAISVSHSGSIIAVAVSRGFSIGVDLEIAGALRLASFESMFLNPDELRSLGGLSDERVSSSLRAIWVTKEAAWKSLSGPPHLSISKITVDCRGDGVMAKIIHPLFQSVAVEATLFSADGDGILAMGSQFWTLEFTPRPFIGCLVRQGLKI